jgi:hypothetical protein
MDANTNQMAIVQAGSDGLSPVVIRRAVRIDYIGCPTGPDGIKGREKAQNM